MKYITVILLLVIFGCSNNENEKIAEKLNIKAIELVADNSIESIIEAQNLLDSAIALYPEKESYYVNKSSCYIRRNMEDSSLITLLEGWKNANTTYHTPLSLGILHDRLNDTVSSHYFYTQSLEILIKNLDTTDINSLLNLKYVQVFTCDSVDFSDIKNHKDYKEDSSISYFVKMLEDGNKEFLIDKMFDNTSNN